MTALSNIVMRHNLSKEAEQDIVMLLKESYRNGFNDGESFGWINAQEVERDPTTDMRNYLGSDN